MFFKIFIFFLDAVAIIGGYILTMLIWVYYQYDIRKFNNELLNWSKAPITDIQILDTECPTNYEPLINSNYSGSFTHCDCTYSTKNKYKGKIFFDICEKEQGNANCTIITGEDGKKIIKWRGKFICVKRLENFNYSNIIEVEKENKCDKYINNYVDTQKNKQCQNLSQGVINYIEINYTNLNKTVDGIKELKLNENYSLYYSNNYPEGNLIIDILITSNDGICASSYEGVFSQNNKEFNKLKGNPNCTILINGYKYDNRYKLIDENVNFIETLKDNNITKYDYLNINKNQTLKLYIIPYIGIKKECYSKFELSNFYYYTIDQNLLFALLISGILSGSVAIIFIFFLIKCCEEKELDYYIRISSFIIFVIYLFCEYKLYDNTINYSVFHSFNCLDDFSYNNYWLIYLGFWLPKIFIGANIVIYTFLFCNALSPYEALNL